jgi:hypothetical protein
MNKDKKLTIMESFNRFLSLVLHEGGGKELKVVFFACNWFDSFHGILHN